MTNRIWSENAGVATLGFGVIGASVYLLMINVTLAHLQAASGYVPFDMRPFGYSYADATELLGALGVNGREYYISHQIPLDTIYPALLAMTLISTLFWFGGRMPNSKLFRLGIVVAVGAALFDYAENLCIMAMIWSWPELPAVLVSAASLATIAKSILTTLAVLLTMLIGVKWAILSKAQFRT